MTLRVDAHAQWEIREFGRVIAGMLKRVAPLSYEAWIDYDVAGARLSRMELDVLRKLVSAHEDGSLEGQVGRLQRGDLLAAGLADREIRELVAKLEKPAAVPDFELDLASALPPSHFEELMAAAVPNADRGSTDD